METHVIRLAQNHMATTFEFSISCTSGELSRAERALEESLREVARLEQELSEFLAESPVHQLNHAKVGEKVRFTSDGFQLLHRSFELRALSANAFDPLAKSEAHSPGLRWDEITKEVWKTIEGTWLGFGAIGKGYALDLVRVHLEKLGFENYLLSAGGSSVVLAGEEGPGQPWKWGWSWKKNELNQNMGVVFNHSSAKRIALGVSGTHEKGAHIISRGGQQENQKSVLIATNSAADADALSTALFVSGWERSKIYLDRLPSPPAVAWIDEKEVPHWNGIFQNLWQGIGACFVATAALFSLFSLHAHSALCDDSVDLSALDGGKTFTPYVFDRNSLWVLLPVFMFLVVLAHLKRTKPLRDRKKLMKKNLTTMSVIVAGLAWLSVETASAGQIEPMGQAVAELLGTSKGVMKKVVNDGASNVNVFYTKGANGKANKVVFIEQGVYKPDCSHTWAIGLNVASGTVSEVKPIEFGCPHALPTKSGSFLEQFKGKGPADTATLSDQIHTIAKATGTCVLATDAVKRSITTLAKNKAQF